jgi:alpha-glucosidase
MRQVTNRYPGGVLVGEVYYPTTAEMENVYGRGDEINLPMATQVGFTDERSASRIGAKLEALMALPPDDSPLLVFNNHDRGRSWDRYGEGLNDAQRARMAKVVAATLLTARGSALMYYGEEIGMKTTDPTRREDVKDPIGRLGWPKDKGRDGERTPMQWNTEKNAGFSVADSTWLPVPPTYRESNVAEEEKNPDSLLRFYKAMLQLRRQNPALRGGGFRSLAVPGRNVLAFLRTLPEGGSVVVALNFQNGPQSANLRVAGKEGKVLLSTFAREGQIENLADVALPPFGVLIATVQ